MNMVGHKRIKDMTQNSVKTLMSPKKDSLINWPPRVFREERECYRHSKNFSDFVEEWNKRRHVELMGCRSIWGEIIN